MRQSLSDFFEKMKTRRVAFIGVGVSNTDCIRLFRKKGIDIRLFSVADNTVIADYYVICSGRASTHVAALADEVDYHLGKVGVRSYRTEGRDGGEWLLVDFGAVIVHVFSREAREYYNLERLLDSEKEIELKEFFDDSLFDEVED